MKIDKDFYENRQGSLLILPVISQVVCTHEKPDAYTKESLV